MRVVIDFFRDVELSDRAFWATMRDGPAAVGSGEQPVWIIPIERDDPGRPRELHGRWIADLNATTRRIAVVSEGDRDAWRRVESTSDGFVAEHDTGVQHLDGHDVESVFTYLDATDLLRAVGALPLAEQRTQTVVVTDRERMQTVARSLALVEGGTSIHLTVSPATMSIERVVRFVDDRVCETVAVDVAPVVR